MFEMLYFVSIFLEMGQSPNSIELNRLHWLLTFCLMAMLFVTSPVCLGKHFRCNYENISPFMGFDYSSPHAALHALKISFYWSGIDCRSVKIGQSMGAKKWCSARSRVKKRLDYMLNRLAKTFALISECMSWVALQLHITIV